MNVFDLVEEMGLHPRRTSSTNGGEYHSPCPNCEGTDRFCVWPKEGRDGRYWCRQCTKSGDAIQFCRDFMGMTYVAACEKVGVVPKLFPKGVQVPLTPKFFSHRVSEPTDTWCHKAEDFIQGCHAYLSSNPHLLNSDKDRGLTKQAILQFKLGWNLSDKFESRASWGLGLSDEGKKSESLCLPEGVVIPSFRANKPSQIKIRRHRWSPEDHYPKYHIVAGSKTFPSLYGDVAKPIIIVEAEFDAMLVQQFAGDICCCVALGGVSNRPDIGLHSILLKSELILYALDFDEAGKRAYGFWRETYPRLAPWPVPKGKSPGDAYIMGVNIRQWIQAGLQNNALNF